LFSYATQTTQQACSSETLKDIIETALAQDTLVFLDETSEFVGNEKSLSMINQISKYPNLFVLRSFTKILA
jgi:histidinol-phosphate/aromatic aminotransferase/cobyric acid decarboxylase-like protein